MNPAKALDMISNLIGMESSDLTRDMVLRRDVNISAIELADLFQKLEEEYKMPLDEGDIENIQTVGDLADYIVDHYEGHPNA